MGFSPESNIQLVNGCDIIKSDERLSWSLNGSGVFRYGNNMDAHEELDCRKVILFYQLWYIILVKLFINKKIFQKIKILNEFCIR